MSGPESVMDIVAAFRGVANAFLADGMSRSSAALNQLTDRLEAAALVDAKALEMAVEVNRQNAIIANKLMRDAVRFRKALERVYSWCHDENNTDSYARQNCEEIARAALEGGEE